VFFFDPSITFFPPPLVSNLRNADVDEDAYTAELQHLFRSQYVNTVAGGGYFYIDQDIDTLSEFYWPTISPPNLLFPPAPGEVDFEIDHYNVYLYSYINLPLDATLTAGASGDFFDANDKTVGNQDIDEDEFNPKFGITWNPFASTTLRGAAFRTFKRTLVTDQTLEPTQVAGFNQFFDEGNATKALQGYKNAFF
jgi:outer membrane receptor protein involved in Fe transport